MKTLTTLSSLLIVILFIFSCSGSKKFDYAKAYQFKKIKYEKHDKQPQEVSEAAVEAESATAVATVDEDVLVENDIKTRIQRAEAIVLDAIEVDKSEAASMEKSEIKSRINALERSDRRAMKRELKRELKSLKKEIAAGPASTLDASEVQQINELQGYTRTGVILGGIGLILLILGAIFGTSALYFVGVGLILAGVVFILVDVL
jgi:hypothetical protein